MTLISAEDASVRFGATYAVRDVSMSINHNEIVTIVGPNGSGKSTLLRLLVGALSPTSGRVVRRPGLKIGYVPQRLSLDTTLPITVERFLCLPHRQPKSKQDYVLSIVGLSDQRHAQVSKLSGGQLQRALLARAVLTEPEILILDEPTQGLDQHGISDFYALISGVHSDLGCAVLMVSHDLHVVMRSSDHVICMNGHICCQGAPTDVSDSPEYLALFGDRDARSLALYSHHHDHAHHHATHTHD
ncbi:MAG: metal ABC transporter ATP-binding protein [Pseudomonadota bacterium]